MKNILLEKVNSWAAENNVLKSGSLVLTGVSGGADSVCLLHVLYSLGRINGFSVAAVHMNHMLRAEESMQDEKFVQNICEQLGIPLRIYRRDVKAYSREKRCSLEEAGRILRYDLFHDVRNELDAQYIAVAHHKEDQAETIFLNLLRGSGLNGICGMEAVQGYIIRPLLNTEKKEIYEYLSQNNLKYRTDSSNFSNVYIRNAIRNRIFPEVERQTGISLAQSLVRTADILKADRDFLERLAEKNYKSIMISKSEHCVELDRSKLAGLDCAISGRIIRIAWGAVTGSRKGLESKHVKTALELAAKKGKNKTIDFPFGIIFKAEYDRVYVMKKKESKTAAPFFIKIQVPSDISLKEWEISAKFRVYQADEYEKSFGRIEKRREKSLIQLFDYDAVTEGINIRYRLPGDVFAPYGGPGKKKLKDFFIDQKVPQQKRDEMLLIAEGKEIIWIVGLRTSEKYKVTKFTKNILYAEITEYNSNKK
ncbi:MAG TPA: tRNA lysidine(34) synthetase TilS [Clostridia bacterium]